MSDGRFHKSSIIIVVSLILIGSIVWSMTPGSPVARVGEFLSSVLSPLQRLARDVRVDIEDKIEAWHAAREIEAENAELRTQLAELRGELRRLETKMHLYDSLEAAIKIRNELDDYELVHGTVLQRGNTPWFDSLSVSLGHRDGLRTTRELKPIVIDLAMQVVGRLENADYQTSVVMPLTAPGFAIAARIDRPNGAVVIVRGGTDIEDGGLLLIDSIPENAVLRPGDELVTAGVGQTFPADLPIGRVSVVESDRAPRRAYCEPYADFDNLENVFVLWPTDHLRITIEAAEGN
ncbi:MAG: rod shape-determining protein MreC [Clostridiaceae bacterium]|nr:rod shape-determining protein MreC [Clostridiaceae bacterium]